MFNDNHNQKLGHQTTLAIRKLDRSTIQMAPNDGNLSINPIK